MLCRWLTGILVHRGLTKVWIETLLLEAAGTNQTKWAGLGESEIQPSRRCGKTNTQTNSKEYTEVSDTTTEVGETKLTADHR